MASNDNLVVARFRTETIVNDAASKAAGRPIYKDMEVCELRFAGDRLKVLVFPAHEAEPNATREAVESGRLRGGEVVTYAMLYGDQYRQFKAQTQQTVAGTPLSELPFLPEAKRREYRAMNVHTAEQLAALDGNALKSLGMGAREHKEQAAAYLANAAGSADATALAAEVARLRAEIEARDEVMSKYAKAPTKTKYQRAIESELAVQAEEDIEARRQEEEREAEISANDAFAPPNPNEGPVSLTLPQEDRADEPSGGYKDIQDCTDAELKAYIKRQTGEAPRGNISHETLVKRAAELADGFGEIDVSEGEQA